MNRRFVSITTILMLVLTMPFASFAVSEEPAAVMENTTIVDTSGMNVNVTAAGDANHKALTRRVTVTVKVK